MRAEPECLWSTVLPLWQCLHSCSLSVSAEAASHQFPGFPGQGSISWLSSFLRAVETHSLQFTDTTVQELGLLWALQTVVDPCTPSW